MARCRRCRGEFGPEELVRHRTRRLEIVHCPDCKAVLGTYRRHGDATVDAPSE